MVLLLLHGARAAVSQHTNGRRGWCFVAQAITVGSSAITVGSTASSWPVVALALVAMVGEGTVSVLSCQLVVRCKASSWVVLCEKTPLDQRGEQFVMGFDSNIGRAGD